MNKENPITKFRGAWGYDVDSVEFVRQLRGGANRKEMYMQTETDDTSSVENSAFKSKYNPKPDPNDKSTSALKYESDLKRFKAIEKLASIDHDQWQFWSMAIMRDLDELIVIIAEQDKALSEYYEDSAPLHLRATEMIRKHNERNARWQKQWCAYTHLSEEIKEHDRLWAKKSWKILSDQK